jgi:hypothetical protein
VANGDGFYYVIREGDTLSKLARRFGLKRWEDIYSHDQNEDFRDLRPNPKVIVAGDHVWIPAKQANKGVLASGTMARFLGRTTDVTLRSLEFLTDHGVLKENDADWTDSGTLIPAPEWTSQKSSPVSLHAPNTLRLKALLQIRSRAKKPIDGTFVGTGNKPWSSLQAPTALQPKSVEVEVAAVGEIPDVVGTLNIPAISWKVVVSDKDYVVGRSGPHTLYVTYGQPIVEGRPEDGVTTRRMRTALEWYQKANARGGTLFVLINRMFKRFKWLNAHPQKKDRLMKAGFPTYFEQGGAWPLAEWERYSGECQAIVRLIRGIKNQLGIPGTAELMYVSADAADHLTPVIRNDGGEPTGPHPDRFFYALVDRKVVINGLYTTDDVGFNAFEAYMKFSLTVGGDSWVAWYGGGIGLVDVVDANDPAAVAELERGLIRVFYALAECSVEYVRGGERIRIHRLWRYR